MGGYTIIEVSSREEALERTRRYPNPSGSAECEVEVRQLMEWEDFEEGPAIERMRELERSGLRSSGRPSLLGIA